MGEREREREREKKKKGEGRERKMERHGERCWMSSARQGSARCTPQPRWDSARLVKCAMGPVKSCICIFAGARRCVACHELDKTRLGLIELIEPR